jgi:hypothetical protein
MEKPIGLGDVGAQIATNAAPTVAAVVGGAAAAVGNGYHSPF